MTRRAPRITRDLTLFGLGFAGSVWQLFFVRPVDAAALAFCAVLLGLPKVFQLDERRRDQ